MMNSNRNLFFNHNEEDEDEDEPEAPSRTNQILVVIEAMTKIALLFKTLGEATVACHDAVKKFVPQQPEVEEEEEDGETVSEDQ